MASHLTPVAGAIARHVRQGETVHADDTPVPVLDHGRGKTKTGRLWVAVRDERPWGSGVPPGVFYRYSPDRKSGFLAQRRKKVQSRYQATKAAIRPTGITMSSRTLVQGGKAPPDLPRKERRVETPVTFSILNASACTQKVLQPPRHPRKDMISLPPSYALNRDKDDTMTLRQAIMTLFHAADTTLSGSAMPNQT